MIITEIQADGFRNLTGKLACSDGINILVGDNAQGKTNWLEAIYLLGNTKSFRTSILRETLQMDDEGRPVKQAFLRGAVLREGLRKDLQVHLEESNKHFYINGKREPVTRYLGNLDVIVFCADEMQIVRGEPSERRRFLDRGVVSLTPSYLKTLAEYNRILKQKNVLLKDAQESTWRQKYLDLIEAWNVQLVEYGVQIHQSRLNYTAKLRRVLGKQLFSDKVIDIHYRSSLNQHGLTEDHSTDDYRELFKTRLKVRLESEIAAGYALVGPHRDELAVLIEGLEASKFGSSGEQRSALITLDLAQMDVYNLAFEEYPVFLIDDIDAELDARRISLLLDHVEGKMQVFISTSKRAIATRYQTKAKCKYIREGSIVSAPTIPSIGHQIDTVEDMDYIDYSIAKEIPIITPQPIITELAKPLVNVAVAQIPPESTSFEITPDLVSPEQKADLAPTKEAELDALIESKAEENMLPDDDYNQLTEDNYSDNEEEKHRAPF